MSEAGHIIGIDLGTTNCAIARVGIEGLDADAAPSVELLGVPQLVAPADVLQRDALPSFLYTPADSELPAGALDLPWATGRDFMIGTAARERGAKVPLRLVSSAKSWLRHGGVDRRSPILPFQSPPEIEKISPVAATTRYIEHLRDAWNHRFPSEPFAAQDIYLTVPASFDAVARELTLEAAKEASIAGVTLLEEPQAAFYAWLARVGDAWRERLRPGDAVLVCDVGGGTTDFSLIEVKDEGGELVLSRAAVGDHILLGGDNMDLLLAHHLNTGLAAKGKKLDAGQGRQLVQAARSAKEKLLFDASLESVPITILGRGSKLIGNKITTELHREDVRKLLLEGFFPACDRDAKPAERKRTGFMELGLPYAQETAVTRHLAAFLARHREGKRPFSHILFNGGVFNSPVLRERLLEIVSGWADEPPSVLQESDHDLAVAKGAAFFGATKHGKAIRIRAGSARSYYVGLETAAPSVPGVEPPIRALCIVPLGLEEGSALDVEGVELGLVVGEPVEFRFLSATHRKSDPMGAVLDEYTWPNELEELAPLSACLPAEGLEPGTVVPVRLEIKTTEIGTIEIWSVQRDGPGRWRLELNVRHEER